MINLDLLQRSLPVLQRLARAAAAGAGGTGSSWAASTSGRGSLVALQHVHSTTYSPTYSTTAAAALSQSHMNPASTSASLPSFWPQPPPRAASTASSLPAPHVYDLRIVIKGYELRYVQQASTVVRDLLLLHTAPKSASVLPPATPSQPDPIRTTHPSTPAHLALPIGDAPTRKQRTLYTVIRSPHKYKSSREQFERVVHRRLVRHSTVSHWELQWILDSLQMYDFTGVQIAVRTTTPTYLQPGPQAPPEPLLAAHRRRFAQDFTLPRSSDDDSSEDGSSASVCSSSSSSGSGMTAGASFVALRGAVRSLMRDQRLSVHSSPNYQEWLARERRSGGAAAGAAAGAAWAASEPGALERAVEALLEQRPELVTELAGAAGKAEGVAGSGKDVFVEAARQVLNELDLKQLQRHELFPAVMAHYPLGTEDAPPAAEWIYAMLKFGLYRQRLANRTSASPQALQQAFAQYGDFAGAMVALLLQRWHEKTATAIRGELGLPDARSTEDMLVRLQKLAKQEHEKAHGGSGGRSDGGDGGWRREQGGGGQGGDQQGRGQSDSSRQGGRGGGQG